MDILKLASNFLKAVQASIQEEIEEEARQYAEEFSEKARQEAIQENPKELSYKADPYNTDFWKRDQDITEEAIRDEAIALGRDPELEAEAFEDRKGFYLWPSVGEIHWSELRELQKKILKGVKTHADANEKFNQFRKEAEELVRQWAVQEKRDPEEQLKLFRGRKSGPFLEIKYWPKESVRPLYREFGAQREREHRKRQVEEGSLSSDAFRATTD